MVRPKPKKRSLNVLITAGPTREYLDPVRFLSNDSSGRMGFEVSAAFQKTKNYVMLIHGPTPLVPPRGVRHFAVTSARDMFSAVKKFLPKADVFIATAAVSDWRFSKTHVQKLKKGNLSKLSVSLEKNPDILAWAGKWKGNHARPLLVGFALETGNVQREALKKLSQKKLDLIIGNTIQSFGGEKIKPIWIETGPSVHPLPLMSKKRLAEKICQWVSKKTSERKDV